MSSFLRAFGALLQRRIEALVRLLERRIDLDL